MGYRVAVVGATGNVGREMLNILEEVNFPVDKIHAIASRKSIGVEVSFGDKRIACEDIEQFDFSTVDVVLMSVSGSFSKEWSPKIGAAGAIVIDNSSAWRMDPDVPLIVPEVNPDDVEWAVEQFGLAMMFLRSAHSTSSGFTSGTTSGTSGSIRQAEELSMTIGPAAPIFGLQILENDPETLISTTSTVEKSNCSMSSHLMTPSFQPTSTPMDLRDAIA